MYTSLRSDTQPYGTKPKVPSVDNYTPTCSVVLKDNKNVENNRKDLLESVQSTIQLLENIKLFNSISGAVDVFSSIVRSTVEFGLEATQAAVINEVMQMIIKGVFRLVTPREWEEMNASKFRQLLPSTLVLKGKYNADNEFQKVKARLVILGNLQKENFENLFNTSSNESPTVSLMGLFSMLVLAAKKKLKIASFDVAGAFLHADIESEVFMKLSKQVARILMESNPEEYQKYLQQDGSMIVQLKKCLYGLRESPRKWYDLIRSVLADKIDLTQCDSDTCIFHKIIEGREVFVALFVDDMLVAGHDEDIEWFEKQLKLHFGDITSYKGNEIDFLGMKITRDPLSGDISVKQQGYIESIVEEDHIREGKRETSPHYCTFSADRSTGDLSGKSPRSDYFRRKVMQLMFLAVRTRPDILFDVVVLSARTENPSNNDLKSLDRILRFVYQTRSDGMKFKSAGKIIFNASVDASFNCYETGRGHSGFCLFPDLLGSAAILYKSLKQQQISKSSTESELISLKEAVQNIILYAELMQELDKTLKLFPITIRQDNASAISLVTNPVVNRQGWSKFINRALFQVNENIEKGEILVVHENTKDLIADFLTKALHGERYRKFRARLMGQDEESQLEVFLGDTVEEVIESIQLCESEGLLDRVVCLIMEE